MAKWKNVPVGTKVTVKKDNLIAGEYSSAGRKGQIIYREPEYYEGRCVIKVEFFDDGTTDWMHHADVKLVKELV